LEWSCEDTPGRFKGNWRKTFGKTHNVFFGRRKKRSAKKMMSPSVGVFGSLGKKDFKIEGF